MNDACCETQNGLSEATSTGTRSMELGYNANNLIM